MTDEYGFLSMLAITLKCLYHRLCFVDNTQLVKIHTSVVRVTIVLKFWNYVVTYTKHMAPAKHPFNTVRFYNQRALFVPQLFNKNNLCWRINGTSNIFSVLKQISHMYLAFIAKFRNNILKKDEHITISVVPFTYMVQLWFQYGWVIASIIMCEVK